MPSDYRELARPSRKLWVLSLVVTLYLVVICYSEGKKNGQPCVVYSLLVDTGDNVPAPRPRPSRAYPQRKSFQDR